MPANLTPQYSAAEEAYKKAKTSEEKLACLKTMFQLLPKHKHSEKMQADLKTKMSKMRDEIEKKKATPVKSNTIAMIPRQGAGQIVILGAPNVGKSSIITKVTKASSTVAPYPFTTREPFPGMMETDEVRVQLIDLPPITKDHLESWQANMIRNADAALLVIDLSDDDGLTATQEVLDRLLEAKIKLSFDDFKSVTRDLSLPAHTMDARTIRRAAGECLKRVDLTRRLRLLGVRAGALATLAELVAPQAATGFEPAPAVHEPRAAYSLPLFEATPPEA